MTTKSKTTRKRGNQATAKGKAPETQPVADCARQMVESMTEAQKRWLDLATQLPFLRPTSKP